MAIVSFIGECYAGVLG